MRIINLIVVHCTATQGNRTLSPEALDLMHRRRGFNGTGYHYYIRKDGTVHLTALSNASVHTQKVLMPAVSESAMKAVWTVGDARQTPGRRNSVLRFGC